MINPIQSDEEIQIKEFLSRTEVRTMRKDMQRLREGEAVKEREKIVGSKTPEEIAIKAAEFKQQENLEQQRAQKEAGVKEAVIEQQTAQDKEVMSQLKNYTSEEEKQKLFYFETEKKNLEQQLSAIEKEEEPPLLLEKNEILLQRKGVEQKLSSTSGQEGEIERQVGTINEASASPAEKQNLERKRWGLEGQREEAEKKRWAVEKEAEAANAKVKDIEDRLLSISARKNELRKRIVDSDLSAKSLFSGVMQREEGRIQEEKDQKVAAAEKIEEGRAVKKASVRREEWAGKLEPEPAEDERKKFIKDIEEWAKEE
ncbi:hypothetical protein KKG36_00435 [Patescibacteria group bacterium]|nr:hypothetical protein [Patescibacteria group bacterium]